jgi:hypothetical protein
VTVQAQCQCGGGGTLETCLDRLHAHPHERHAFCPRRERWSVIDLEGIMQSGYGERR